MKAKSGESSSPAVALNPPHDLSLQSVFQNILLHQQRQQPDSGRDGQGRVREVASTRVSASQVVKSSESSSESLRPSPGAPVIQEWSCSSCTLLNDKRVWKCALCGSDRVKLPSPKVDSAPVARPCASSSTVNAVDGSDDDFEKEDATMPNAVKKRRRGSSRGATAATDKVVNATKKQQERSPKILAAEKSTVGESAVNETSGRPLVVTHDDDEAIYLSDEKIDELFGLQGASHDYSPATVVVVGRRLGDMRAGKNLLVGKDASCMHTRTVKPCG